MSKKISRRNQKKMQAKIAANANRNGYYGYRQSGGYHNTDSKRNMWQVGGLQDQLTFDDFYNLYRRNGIAKAGILKPVDRCWMTLPMITDGEHEDGKEREKTDFEKDLDILINDYNLFERLRGLDIRQRVGRYGGIVIIAKGDSADSKEKLKTYGIKSLIKLMPVYESQIDVTQDNQDIASADFGNPAFYNFRSDALGARSDASLQQELHPSRVFAFGEGADDGTIYGVPALEAPFNPLVDWEKVRISASEGYYKNAKQRIALNINDTETAGAFLNEENQAAFDKNVNDFGKGWDSSLLLSGMDVVALQSAITDPTGTAGMCLQEIVSGLNIPKTILIGFETGERSSTENSKVFNEDMMSRRELTLNHMIRGFLNHLIEVGIMSKPENEICIEWDDLLASSDEEQLDNADKMVTINQKSFQAGGTQIYTEEEIREAGGYEYHNDDLEEDIMVDDYEEESV